MPVVERDDHSSSHSRWIQSACVLGLGFVVAVVTFRYKLSRAPLRPKLKKLNKMDEDPVRLATRALAWGTLFSVLGTGSLGATILYGLSVYKKSIIKSDQ